MATIIVNQDVFNKRPDVHEYFMVLAMHAASRASCPRRRVGCVLVDENGYVVSTGYNGPPKGIPNCTDHPCPGVGCKSGEGLNLCIALHAEENAIKHCANIYKIHTAYVTSKPCQFCMSKFANTSVKRIIYLQDYPHTETDVIASKANVLVENIQWMLKPESIVFEMAKIQGFKL